MNLFLSLASAFENNVVEVISSAESMFQEGNSVNNCTYEVFSLSIKIGNDLFWS